MRQDGGWGGGMGERRVKYLYVGRERLSWKWHGGRRGTIAVAAELAGLTWEARPPRQPPLPPWRPGEIKMYWR